MTELCGIGLRHPVINASGCFDAVAAGRVPAFGGEQTEYPSTSPEFAVG